MGLYFKCIKTKAYREQEEGKAPGTGAFMINKLQTLKKAGVH